MKHVLEPGHLGLRAWLNDHAYPQYRASQIRRWLFQRRVSQWNEMTDLPKRLRVALSTEFTIWTTRIAAHQKASDGTEKLLLEFGDGSRTECVLLPGASDHSICISTQVGCSMGCVFCASGLDGVQRNLTASEIVEQMLRLQLLLAPTHRISRIVVMGMGEPLANLKQLLPALDEARDPEGLGIGTRRITIYTVGIAAGIRQLANHSRRYPLAISLHAPNDHLRSQLVPVNRQHPLSDLMEAAELYFRASGRRVTYEYVMLARVNDHADHAEQLVRLLRGRTALVNLIPYNPVAGLPFRAPTEATVTRFCQILENGGVQVQVRQRKGAGIQAACGQLRRDRPVF